MRHHQQPPPPYSVELEFLLKLPVRPTYEWPVIGDVDKLARAVVDGLVQGGALQDDRHVTALTVTKRYAEGAEEPGVRCAVASVRIAA
jgi:Holliday junction resolvase RusA-like endonuclease